MERLTPGPSSDRTLRSAGKIAQTLERDPSYRVVSGRKQSASDGSYDLEMGWDHHLVAFQAEQLAKSMDHCGIAHHSTLQKDQWLQGLSFYQGGHIVSDKRKSQTQEDVRNGGPFLGLMHHVRFGEYGAPSCNGSPGSTKQRSGAKGLHANTESLGLLIEEGASPRRAYVIHPKQAHPGNDFVQRRFQSDEFGILSTYLDDGPHRGVCPISSCRMCRDLIYGRSAEDFRQQLSAATGHQQGIEIYISAARVDQFVHGRDKLHQWSPARSPIHRYGLVHPI
jgi:hypothetical protein